MRGNANHGRLTHNGTARGRERKSRNKMSDIRLAIFLSGPPEFAKPRERRQPGPCTRREYRRMTSIRSIVLALTLVISGCVPIYRHHGYVPPEEDLAQVVVGQTTQMDLETLVGRPSSQGLLAGSGWYYVGSRWRYYGPTRPQEIQH